MNQNSTLWRRPGRRRKESQQRHREEILAAALKVFARKGYHQASMQEIAAEADFAVGTLYRFFPSKKALYEALVLEEISRFHQKMMAVFAQCPADPIKALEQVIRHRLRLIEEHLTFIRVYLAELWEARFRGGLIEEVRRYYDEYLEALGHVLAGLSPLGLPQRRLASIVDGLFATLVVEAIESQAPLPSWEEIMALLQNPLIRRSCEDQ